MSNLELKNELTDVRRSRSALSCSASKGRLPSYERGCKGKIKLGRKRHKKNADRLAIKHGHALGVYWCRWCGNYHATKKIDGEKIYEGLVHISLPNAEAEQHPKPPNSTNN